MLLGHRFSSNPVMHSIGWCSLAEERCLELTICIGIEYSPDRCELWTRTAGTGNGAVCVPFGAVGGRDQSQMRCTWFPLAIWTDSDSHIFFVANHGNSKAMCVWYQFGNYILLPVPSKSGTTIFLDLVATVSALGFNCRVLGLKICAIRSSIKMYQVWRAAPSSVPLGIQATASLVSSVCLQRPSSSAAFAFQSWTAIASVATAQRCDI